MEQKNKIICIVLILIIIVASILGIFLYNEEHRVNEKREEVKELVKEVVSIDLFTEKLKENNIEIESETSNKECGLIGASDGISYMIKGKLIQVYRFDFEKSDDLTVSNLKMAQEEQRVLMPSFNDYEFRVKYNKGLILINYEDHPLENEIIEIFESL